MQRTLISIKRQKVQDYIRNGLKIAITKLTETNVLNIKMKYEKNLLRNISVNYETMSHKESWKKLKLFVFKRILKIDLVAF